MERPAVTLIAWLATIFVATPSAAVAQIWIDATDAQARRDVEVLAAAGRIRGPVSSWPLAWAQLLRDLDAGAAEPLPAHVRRAEERLRALAARRQSPGIRFTARAAVQDEQLLVRGVGEPAREDGNLSLSAESRLGDAGFVRLRGGWRDDQRGTDATFDGSHIAAPLGNWVFYGGTVDQWWGGGWDGAMVVSTNARPFPRIGVQRLVPYPLDLPVLRWLGPMSLTVSAGRMESDRAVSHPIAFLSRAVFQPARGLDIGLSRTLQICGEGRDCDLEQWARALVGIADLDNTGDPEIDPSNQLAAVDVRFGRTVGEVGYAFYAELMGEDQGAFLLKAVSGLIGTSLDGHWRAPDLGWRLRFEAADTRADRVFGLSNPQLGTTYNHSVYRDGWSFQGRTIGHGLDTDSRLLSAEAHALDAGDRSYRLTYRHAVVNDSGSLRHKVSDVRESLHIVELGFRTPLPAGHADLGFVFQTDQANTPGRLDRVTRFELGWVAWF